MLHLVGLHLDPLHLALVVFELVCTGRPGHRGAFEPTAPLKHSAPGAALKRLRTLGVCTVHPKDSAPWGSASQPSALGPERHMQFTAVSSSPQVFRRFNLHCDLNPRARARMDIVDLFTQVACAMREFTVEEQFTPARTVMLTQSNLGFEPTAPLKHSAPWRASRKSHAQSKVGPDPQPSHSKRQRLCTLGVCISILCIRHW